MEWPDRFQPVTVYDPERIGRFNFNASTGAFLQKVGLPEDAAPFLSFVKDNDLRYEGIMKLTDYFDFLEPACEKYVVIGSDSSGDEMVIDTADACKIKLLDHEDRFAERLVNTSIEQLHRSLMIYGDFVDEVIRQNGEEAFMEGNFNDTQWTLLKQRLTENDPDAMHPDCFWCQELELLIANRDEDR
jgi:hypothetical protein